MSQSLLPLSFLGALLMAAVVSDLRRRRIPNALVLYGTGLGLAFQSFWAAAAAGPQAGLLGLGAALLGGLSGLGLFLPLYALRMLGAGDVKLLAMVGVWLGAGAVLHAALWTMLVGGAMALMVVAATRLQLGVRLAGTALGTPSLDRPARDTRLPYAVAIAAGTAIEVWQLLFTAA